MSKKLDLAKEHTTKGHAEFVDGCPVCENERERIEEAKDGDE